MTALQVFMAAPRRVGIRLVLIVLVLGLASCAHRDRPPPGDATRDPEFQAALRAARPEFPRQREALEAGLYEAFVPPESLLPSDSLADLGAPPEDPSTEELLRSLPKGGRVLAPPRRVAVAPAPPTGVAAPSLPAEPHAAGTEAAYAIQMGAFNVEFAARARAEEVRARIPELPVRIVREGGLFRVFLGDFASRTEAEAALRSLAGRGLGASWVRRLDRQP